MAIHKKSLSKINLHVFSYISVEKGYRKCTKCSEKALFVIFSTKCTISAYLAYEPLETLAARSSIYIF